MTWSHVERREVNGIKTKSPDAFLVTVIQRPRKTGNRAGK
jgi:hypothetical protein